MSFYDAMQAAGLYPRDVIADGKWHRCPTRDKPKKRNGAFLLAVDGRRGWFKNFATDMEFNVWSDGKPITEAQQRHYDAQLKAALAAERARQSASVAAMVTEWATLKPVTSLHPYLERKGLTANGCAGMRLRGDDLVIPMRIDTGLRSFQTITPEGQKRYRAGCPISGAYHLITRENATVTAFVEGVATGLAIFQCIPMARVVVCFDSGNLAKVAMSWRGKGLAVVCADDDHKNAVNTGLLKGIEAAGALGCGIATPQRIEGTDWADALAEWSGKPDGGTDAHRKAMAASRVMVEVMRGAKYVS